MDKYKDSKGRLLEYDEVLKQDAEDPTNPQYIRDECKRLYEGVRHLYEKHRDVVWPKPQRTN